VTHLSQYLDETETALAMTGPSAEAKASDES
jgi:hypothetical protein